MREKQRKLLEHRKEKKEAHLIDARVLMAVLCRRMLLRTLPEKLLRMCCEELPKSSSIASNQYTQYMIFVYVRVSLCKFV